MVPADVRLLAAKHLFLNEVALTGEALPVERKADPAPIAAFAMLGSKRYSAHVEPGLSKRRRP